MPSLTTSIQGHGAIVQLGVFVSAPRAAALRAAGMPVPPPILVNGLIDTGASCTCIDTGVIQQLGLQPTGTIPIITSSTGNVPHICQQFDVSVGVVLGSDIHIIETLPVIEAPLSNQGHQALIGRDILSNGILIYNGKDGSVTLAF